MSAHRSTARTHVFINFGLQLLLLGCHLLLAISAIVNAVLFFYGDAGWGPYADDAFDQGRRAGNLLAIVAVGSWGVVGMVWTMFNAYGLWNRRPWARSSTSAYWILSMFTLFGLPLSIYGLISLGIPEVREELAREK